MIHLVLMIKTVTSSTYVRTLYLKMMMNKRSIICYFAGIVTTLSIVTLYNLLNLREHSYVRRKKAVFFGDSITQHGSNTSNHGWVARFTEWWFRRVDVINRGFSGYNTKWGLMVIDAVIKELPDIVFICFGANDAIDEKIAQHVSLDNYEKNLKDMINIITKSIRKVKIVLITPPPIDEGKLQQSNKSKGKVILLDRTNQRALQYASVCKDIAKKHHLPLVDVWSSLSGDTEKRADFLVDGLHLNELGNEKFFEAVKKVVISNYPDCTPEAIPMHLNEWMEMIVQENKKLK